MDIEIIDFYPFQLDKTGEALKGTIRVKLRDLGIHILGIQVYSKKSSWFFSLPGREAIDHRTGEKVRYPFISFDDKSQSKEFNDELMKQAPAFIEKRLLELKERKAPIQQKPKGADIANEPMSKPVVSERSKAPKVWTDPPKKSGFQRNAPKLKQKADLR